MQKSHVDIIMSLFCLNENNCVEKNGEKNQKKIVIVKNNIAIRIGGKVSQYIDASMNRATPIIQPLVSIISSCLRLRLFCVMSQKYCPDIRTVNSKIRNFISG